MALDGHRVDADRVSLDPGTFGMLQHLEKDRFVLFTVGRL